jgi:hypothetical protein
MELIEDLDTEWLNNFNEIDNQYTVFYPESIKNLQINFIYLNKNNEIIKINQKKILLSKPGLLFNSVLKEMIQQEKKILDKKYQVIDIVKINISLTHSTIKSFLNTFSTKSIPSFIQTISPFTVDNILFEPSIPMFSHLNSLYILFSEQDLAFTNTNNNNNNQTKRIKSMFNRLLHNKTKKSI